MIISIKTIVLVVSVDILFHAFPAFALVRADADLSVKVQWAAQTPPNREGTSAAAAYARADNTSMGPNDYAFTYRSASPLLCVPNVPTVFRWPAWLPPYWNVAQASMDKWCWFGVGPIHGTEFNGSLSVLGQRGSVAVGQHRVTTSLNAIGGQVEVYAIADAVKGPGRQAHVNVTSHAQDPLVFTAEQDDVIEHIQVRIEDLNLHVSGVEIDGSHITVGQALAKMSGEVHCTSEPPVSATFSRLFPLMGSPDGQSLSFHYQDPEDKPVFRLSAPVYLQAGDRCEISFGICVQATTADITPDGQGGDLGCLLVK